MAIEYFNYGLAKDILSKMKDGMWRGGYQYEHPGRPKPVAWRGIGDRNWINL
jgi:hypothetical protein